jgi:hypothetical protein
VHGPLVAIVLARLLVLNDVDRIARFEFRARSPLFVNQPIRLMGKRENGHVGLRAVGPSGMLAMEATAWIGDAGAMTASQRMAAEPPRSGGPVAPAESASQLPPRAL